MGNHGWRVALFGAFGGIVVAGLIGAAYAGLGFYNVAADSPHTGIVAGFLAFVRERSIDVRGEDIKAPTLDKPDMIAEGASHYDAMCTACHLAPGMPENEMRPGLNPKPPLLASHPPDSPGEAFWVIKHGIKMTAMPAWGVTHTDAEIWNIVAFLEVLPKLSPQQYRALVAKAAGHHHEMGSSDEHMKM
jgi:mono/diheme cytochrome c family protein